MGNGGLPMEQIFFSWNDHFWFSTESKEFWLIFSWPMFNFHGEYFLIKQSKRTDRFHRKRTHQGHQFATLQRCGKSEEWRRGSTASMRFEDRVRVESPFVSNRSFSLWFISQVSPFSRTGITGPITGGCRHWYSSFVARNGSRKFRPDFSEHW